MSTKLHVSNIGSWNVIWFPCLLLSSCHLKRLVISFKTRRGNQGVIIFDRFLHPKNTRQIKILNLAFLAVFRFKKAKEILWLITLTAMITVNILQYQTEATHYKFIILTILYSFVKLKTHQLYHLYSLKIPVRQIVIE